MAKCWYCNGDNDGEIVNNKCTNCGNRQYYCNECKCTCDGMVIGFYGEVLCDACYEKQ